jgi:hypothetical protein
MVLVLEYAEKTHLAPDFAPIRIVSQIVVPIRQGRYSLNGRDRNLASYRLRIDVQANDYCGIAIWAADPESCITSKSISPVSEA